LVQFSILATTTGGADKEAQETGGTTAAHKHPGDAAAKLLQVIERKGIEAVV
jgi:hypothetical protein